MRIERTSWITDFFQIQDIFTLSGSNLVHRVTFNSFNKHTFTCVCQFTNIWSIKGKHVSNSLSIN